MHENDLFREIREMRTAITDGQLQSLQRLTAIETHMKSLIGNGQPGRISILEKQVASNTRFRYKVVGYTVAINSVLTGLWLAACSYLPTLSKGR